MASAAPTPLSRTASAPETTRPWSGVFETPPEVDAEVTDIEGQVPEGLVGALYRNGPGRLTLADHLFDGDGMVSKIAFGANGTVHVRNRFVRTRKYEVELRATKPRVAGYGTRAAGGILRNALRPPTGASNAANTSVMFSAGRLLALWEAGHPWQLDPETLETLGELDFDGELESRFPFSAHPHWDPETKEIFNFGMVYGPRNGVATYRIDPRGRLHPVARTRLPHPVMNHDFIITRRWLVFCLGPVRVSLPKLLTGRAAFGDALRFRHGDPTLVVLVPRDGAAPVFVEAEPWFQFHFAGAFDDGDDVIVDLVRYPDYENIGTHVKRFRATNFSGIDSKLWRFRIDPRSRRVEGRQVTDADVEFPQVDGRRATGEYRIVHAAITSRGHGFTSGIGRIDVESGQTTTHDFGAGRVASEPLFVPRPGSIGEDDGWLLATVYDPDRGASDAVVLDARDPSAGPLCTAHLPVNTGVSFHGTWRAA